MTEYLLRVENLSAGYESPVFAPLSFEIRKGEVLGLVGPNGSGKSTLLKAIGGRARIFEGRIVRNESLSIAWMEQQPVHLPEMPFDGYEYLRYAQAARTPPPQLEQWLGQRIDALSGGQFQLLSCWTVLGSDAALIMLDEPTNNLDAKSERALETILSAPQGERGILLVSHDRAFIEKVSDRMMDLSS